MPVLQCIPGRGVNYRIALVVREESLERGSGWGPSQCFGASRKGVLRRRLRRSTAVAERVAVCDRAVGVWRNYVRALVVAWRGHLGAGNGDVVWSWRRELIRMVLRCAVAFDEMRRGCVGGMGAVCVETRHWGGGGA